MEQLFLGGYTRKNNEGIHILNIDIDADGKMKVDEKQLIKEGSPTYLAKSENGDKLFSITTREDGGIVSYILKDGKYEQADIHSGMMKAPCHLYYDEKRELLYSSNYHLGRLDIIKVDDELKMERMSTIQFNGKGKISPDQDSSKCHMSVKDPFDKYLIVVDLGDDAVHTYYITDVGNYRLISTYRTDDGMGPRHIVFSEDGRYAYLIGELNSKIDILEYNFSEGEFVQRGQVSTLPEGYDGKNTAAAIKISKDGKFVYASNRGHNSIAVFRVQNDGKLERVQIIETGGETPRDFGFSRNDEYLFAGHQNSDFVTVFKRNAKNGTLEYMEGMDIEAPETVCVME